MNTVERLTLVRPPNRLLAVSGRELEVLEHVARGEHNDTIARELEISIETVKTHVRALLYKLNAKTRAHAVSIGYANGLIGTSRRLEAARYVIEAQTAHRLLAEHGIQPGENQEWVRRYDVILEALGA